MWNRQFLVLEINLWASHFCICHKISPKEHLTELTCVTPQLPDGLLSDSQWRSPVTDSSAYFMNLHGLKIRLSLVAPSLLWENCFMSHSVYFYHGRAGFLSRCQSAGNQSPTDMIVYS